MRSEIQAECRIVVFWEGRKMEDINSGQRGTYATVGCFAFWTILICMNITLLWMA